MLTLASPGNSAASHERVIFTRTSGLFSGSESLNSCAQAGLNLRGTFCVHCAKLKPQHRRVRYVLLFLGLINWHTAACMCKLSPRPILPMQYKECLGPNLLSLQSCLKTQQLHSSTLFQVVSACQLGPCPYCWCDTFLVI